MIITYHGGSMIKVQQGERIIVFNPIGRSVDFKPVRFGADLALVSLADPSYNGVDEVTFGDRQPFVIDGPGEYEVAGTFIRGFASLGAGQKINTIYDVTVDGKRLVHLGALVDPELPPKVKEELAQVDILFVPIGQPRLAAAAAYQLALALNPHLVVPVHYISSTLTNFLKEAGEEPVEAEDKLTLKGRELLDREGEVVVLEVV